MKNKVQPFKVHKTPLQSKTSFLQKVQPAQSPIETRHDIQEIDFDLKSETEGSGVDQADSHRVVTSDENVFDLRKTNVKAEPFTVIVDYIYNKNPGSINNYKEANVAIRAYILAVQYDIGPLQNALVDQMRDYHAKIKFKFDLLVLMINRHPDVKCNMAQYLVSQMAYDISESGYDHFELQNGFYKRFIEENTREARLEVFKAIVDIAEKVLSKKKVVDPAQRTGEAMCKWHVHTDGARCTRMTQNA